MAVIKCGKSICSEDGSLEKRGIFKKDKVSYVISVLTCKSYREKGDGVKRLSNRKNLRIMLNSIAVPCSSNQWFNLKIKDFFSQKHSRTKPVRKVHVKNFYVKVHTLEIVRFSFWAKVFWIPKSCPGSSFTFEHKKSCTAFTTADVLLWKSLFRLAQIVTWMIRFHYESSSLH